MPGGHAGAGLWREGGEAGKALGGGRRTRRRAHLVLGSTPLTTEFLWTAFASTRFAAPAVRASQTRLRLIIGPAGRGESFKYTVRRAACQRTPQSMFPPYARVLQVARAPRMAGITNQARMGEMSLFPISVNLNSLRYMPLFASTPHC